MSEPALVAPAHEGDVLGGKYRVERVIGAGGMGVVVAAQHLQLGKRVAVKFLLPQACANAEAVERFLREARAAVSIESEHVARVIDVGTLETGAPYMVMEFLVGSDLSQVLRARGPLPIEEAVDYVLQACEAIAEAHAIGIVHRDLKPANLFLTQRKDGSALIKVLDFGISKAVGMEGSQPSMTATTAVMGSPQYMSPEQIRSSKNIDGRTDIWSLGMIAYELLAGRPAYESDTLTGLCAMIASDPPTPLRRHRADVPEPLEAVVMRCLAKDPAQRFQNVGELAIALLPFGSKASRLSVERTVRVIQGAGLSASALALPPSNAPPPPQAIATAGTWAATGASRSRRLSWILAGAVAGVLLMAGVLSVSTRARQTAPGSSGLVAKSATTSGAALQPAVASPPSAPSSAAPVASTSLSAAAATPAAPSSTVRAAPGKKSAPGPASATAPTAATAPQTEPAASAKYNAGDYL
jgi:serine/threonine-protein kinase